MICCKMTKNDKVLPKPIQMWWNKTKRFNIQPLAKAKPFKFLLGTAI